MWSSRAAHRNLRIPSPARSWRNRSFAAVVFKRGVSCSHTAVVHKLHGSRGAQPASFAIPRRAASQGLSPAATQVVLALPRHPLPLLRQHVLPRDKPHPALALGFFLVGHLAHIDGVAPPRVLHGALVVLGRVVVDVVIWVVRRRVVAVVPC
jgi:hypothetical protein